MVFAGCAAARSLTVVACGPHRCSSISTNLPAIADCSINFHETDPGGVSFRAWSAIMISAFFSNFVTSPPFDYRNS